MMLAFVCSAAALTLVLIAAIARNLLRFDTEERTASRIALGVTALLLPLAAALLYWHFSSWEWDPRLRAAAADDTPDVSQMIAQLEARLKTHPDDADGWLLLGRSKYVLKDYSAAAHAYGEAYRATKGQDLEALLGYAESLALSDPDTLKGKAGELFETALALDPSNPKALWFAGLAASINGRSELAESRWMTLLQQALPQNIKVIVAERLTALATASGRPVNPRVAALLLAAASSSQSAPTTQGEGAVARPEPPERTVRVHVTVDPRLANKVPTHNTLFVLARDPSAPGPPLAVKRFDTPTMPLDVVLSSKDAMLPNRTIATATHLVIVARYSLSGQPVAAAGDLSGEIAIDPAHTDAADVSISSVVR
jgi:cytochrome c-type biogenesis protein CcmH